MLNTNKENSSNTITVYIGGKHHCVLVGRANTGLEFARDMGGDDSIESFFHPYLNIHRKTLSAFITKDSDITHGKYLALLGNFFLLAS